jgi:hypothetical protein
VQITVSPFAVPAHLAHGDFIVSSARPCPVPPRCSGPGGSVAGDIVTPTRTPTQTPTATPRGCRRP